MRFARVALLMILGASMASVFGCMGLIIEEADHHYSNENYNYGLDYPSYCQIVDEDSNGVIISEEGNQYRSVIVLGYHTTANVNMCQQEDSDAASNFEADMRGVVTASNGTNFQLLTNKRSSGCDWEISFLFTDESSERMYTIHYIKQVGNTIYQLTLTHPNSQDWSEGQDIIDSFEIE